MHFWMEMTYQCRGRHEQARFGDETLPAAAPCGFEMAFLLEDGCEGPREGDGWVPVPFVAGCCPNCETGVLQHVRRNEDRAVDIGGPAEFPHFRIPTDKERRRYGNSACGVPVYSYHREDYLGEPSHGGQDG